MRLIAIVLGRIRIVFDWPLDVDDDAATGVDQLLEAAEIDPGVVMDGDAEGGVDGALGQVGSADGSARR